MDAIYSMHEFLSREETVASLSFKRGRYYNIHAYWVNKIQDTCVSDCSSLSDIGSKVMYFPEPEQCTCISHIEK